MVSKNKLCSYSPKGLYEQKNYKDSLRLYPEQFYKIEFFQFRTPQISEMSQNSKRKGKLLNMIWKIENVTILKERDGDILGFHNFRISEFGILKLSIF